MSVNKKNLLNARKNFSKDKWFAFILVSLFFLFVSYQSVSANSNNANSNNTKENSSSIQNENQNEIQNETNVSKNNDKAKFASIKKILKEKNEQKESENLSNKEPVDAYLFQILRSLGIVIGILFIILYFVKKFSGATSLNQNIKDGINIIERKSLTPKSQLFLISVKKKNFLVGVNTNSISVTKIDNEFEEENFEEESEIKKETK